MTEKTINVSELTGALLAYWVALATGIASEVLFFRAHWQAERRDAGEKILWYGTLSGHGHYFEPHKNWGQGGPLIEDRKIGLDLPIIEGGWRACTAGQSANGSLITAYGSTPLIAAMRLIVKKKFGDTVPDIAATQALSAASPQPNCLRF